ncbi:hypothetical protein N7509_008795 [Penicillium cosmopolitanum]|uniref:Oxidoreductase n=1 Tax=Penicillium cosmopolitanum TaxID=1131564 RepID=A0A9X0B300_9EURO|nr:uncharacterized protein N7509_008795 [Penicillium cosmopolitanum]KAJ5386254.1 hypothetical protein N7509_008795 [Penicillium cosmopolitanum]
MGHHGTFEVPKSAQTQNKPGLESKMASSSESTKLEHEGSFIEYAGSNKLEDKKVLVTGGESIAVFMAREGADISLVYLPKEQGDAEATKKMIEKDGRQCLLLPEDLRDRDFCHSSVEEHVKRFGKLNVLVNNASKQYITQEFPDIDLDRTEDIFMCNIIQMIAMAKFALVHMSRGDSIINTSSVVTFRGSGTMVDYSATKGPIVGFTKSLAKYLIPKGIRVNAVAPGAIYTPIQADTRDARQMEGWGRGAGLGRPGEPSEVATCFVFLASADASLYYGQVLHCYPLGD